MRIMKFHQTIAGLLLVAQILPTLPTLAGGRVVQVGEAQWDDIKEFSEGLAGVCKDGQWGFIDASGKLAIELQRDWKYAFPFEGGLAQVEVAEANFDFVDKTGRAIVRLGQGSTNIDGAWPRMLMTSPFRNLAFSYGLIPVSKKGGKLGFMNQQGRVVVSPQWDQVFDFHEGLASVKIYDASNHNSHAGFINTNGQVVIPLQWDGALSFSEGMAAVTTNGLWGFIDKTGTVVIPPQWDSCESFRDGFALVSKKYKFGVIDRTGKTIVEPKFTGFMLGNPILVFQEGKKGIIDKSGQVASGLWWDSVKYPPMRAMVNDRDSVEYRPKVAANYTVKVEKDKKWGLADIIGRIVVQPTWEDVGFSEAGLTPVKQDGKWGILDQSGKFVVHPRWESVSYPALTGKTITAKENGKLGLFDTTGKLVAKPGWDAVSKFSEGFAAMQVGTKWGLIDQVGNVICAPKWDFAEPPRDGLLRVRDGDKWLLMRVEQN